MSCVRPSKFRCICFESKQYNAAWHLSRFAEVKISFYDLYWKENQLEEGFFFHYVLSYKLELRLINAWSWPVVSLKFMFQRKISVFL